MKPAVQADEAVQGWRAVDQEVGGVEEGGGGEDCRLFFFGKRI